MTDASPMPEVQRLARNLARVGGRYALYPPPRAFLPFSDSRFCAAIRDSNGDPIPAQLALHFDIPAAYRGSFCGGGATIRASDRARAEAYRNRLVREIGLVGGLFDRDRDVVQVSLAPGMAGWMDATQVGELLESLDRHFHLRRSGGIDFALTVDADRATASPLADWAALGFNRVGVSIGALFCASGVVPAARALRVQATVDELHDTGFNNVRVELPYGIPGQTLVEFRELVTTIVQASPERVGLRNCAPLLSPDMPASAALPAALLQAEMLLAAADLLEEAGLLHVGVDVFARPTDTLVSAQRRGRLHRDALGFGAHGSTDLIGFGVGAISQIGGCHAQNPLDLTGWEGHIDRGLRAVDHGVELDEDDRIRAELLQEILCQGRVSWAELEERFALDFRDAFRAEISHLTPLFEDGSLAWDGPVLRLDRIARLSARAIAAVFDRHSWRALCEPTQLRSSG
jgi:oxygen-independent coproporphyrinogen-3 oxidase